MRITFDTGAIGIAIVDALDRMGHDWEDLAKTYAPVRKPRENRAGPYKKPIDVGARSASFAVRLGPSRNLTNVQRRFRAEMISRTPRQRAQFLSEQNDLSYEHRRSLASVFRFAEGPNKGKAPEVLVTHGSRVRGVTRENEQGGTLRESIHFQGVDVSGSKATATLKASAPYAKFIEEGFRHKGGGEIKGRWFMRKSRDEVKDRLKAGNYFKKG